MKKKEEEPYSSLVHSSSLAPEKFKEFYKTTFSL